MGKRHGALEDSKMQVKNLMEGSSVDEITLEVTRKDEPREVKARGKNLLVCDAQGTDDNGDTIDLTLWDDEVDTVHEGETIKIVNGYVKRYKGELQLSSGKFGEIEHV